MDSQQLDELSGEELERIEHLIAAASAGPWFSYLVGRDTQARCNCIELGDCNELGSFKSIALIGGTAADQDFIASARQDLPRLLREARRLRARLGSLAVQGRAELRTAKPAPDGTAPLRASPM